MHLPLSAEYGVHRAGRKAAGATNARVRIDPCQPWRGFHAVLGVQRQALAVQERCELPDHCRAARRALVDLRLATRQRLRVGEAAGVSASRALRLRQQRIDFGSVNLPHSTHPQWHNMQPW
jgi:hypothetical protein